MTAVIPSRVTGTNHLALLDELNVGSLFQPPLLPLE